MAKPNPPFVNKIMSKLIPHGPITVRSMFGGYGIYYERVMFASIYEGALYFRIDEVNRSDFLKYKSRPFIYEGMKKAITLPYMSLPNEILNDPDELPGWIHSAYQAALRKSGKKRRRLGHKPP